MKLSTPLAFLFLAILVQTAAAKDKAPTAKPAAASETADPFASFKTADELWKHIEKLRKEPSVQPKSREEFIATITKWFGGQKAAAEAFLKRFPEDPRRYSAQMLSIQASLQLGRIPGAPPESKPNPEEQRQQIDAILAAADAPEEAKGEATFVQALLHAEAFDPSNPETAAPFLKASDEFFAKYAKHSLAPQMRQAQLQIVSKLETPEAEAVLTKLAADPDPRLAGAAKQLLAQRQKMKDLKTKPVELKFTATNGKKMDLEKLRGKVVLVDFWASWCGPCITEMPHVTAAYAKLRDKGFEILGISLDQDKAAMEGSIKKLGMTWPQYFDGKGWQNSISTSFGINSIPAAWLIDKKGMLRETDLRGEALGAGVEKLLAE